MRAPSQKERGARWFLWLCVHMYIGLEAVDRQEPNPVICALLKESGGELNTSCLGYIGRRGICRSCSSCIGA